MAWEGTKIIYHIDDEDTPYLVRSTVPPGRVTLGDFKNALYNINRIYRPNYKFFFKSMDGNFGVVKKEISDDNEKLPSVDGRVVTWLVTAEGNSLPERAVGIGDSRPPSFHATAPDHRDLGDTSTETESVISSRKNEKSMQTSLCINPIPCLESLSEDLEKLLQLDSHSNPDVEFQINGHCIKAHRLVVSVRSPVLAKMLQSEMVEGTTGIIKIEDMDLDSLKHFVRYLYTGRLEAGTTIEAALALYEAADKYEVKSLFRRCAQYLLENLSVENACNVLAVADAHNDEELVRKVTIFILRNKMPISDDEHWSTFCDSHTKLANKVYHRFFKSICK